jgi:PAS domain S-box-containing protein
VIERNAVQELQSFVDAAPDAIVIVDSGGKIATMNALAGEMFAYSREELLGSGIEVLVPSSARGRHEHDRRAYADNPRTRMMGAGRYLHGRRSTGEEFPVQISLAPYRQHVISIIRDVTEERRAEELTQASLREKEALLREIHHRVKNNLQVTSSLLRLQAAAIEDGRVKEMFGEAQHRIRSMALVHEKLYQSTNLAQIDFAEYSRTLGDLLFRSFAVDPSAIRLLVEGASIFLSVETAVPCGLILNEALSNALKHAFPGGRSGTIVVRLDRGDGWASLSIADNGVGLPPSMDIDTVESLGLQLVRGLVQQIDGKLELMRDNGTLLRIVFPLEAHAHA